MDEASLKRKVVEGLNAFETKAQYDPSSGWQYSKRLISWGPRAKFLDMALKVRGFYAPEKREMSGQIVIGSERPKEKKQDGVHSDTETG